MLQRTIIIMGYVWPENKASAAGIRTWQWVHYFLSRNWRVVFSTGAGPSSQIDLLNKAGVETANWIVNQPGFEDWVNDIHPDLALFDRYVVEEQFGWRVRAVCPQALRVIDSQDFHALRKIRHENAKKREQERELGWSENLDQILNALKGSDDLLREFAAFLRSDCAILISPFEKQLIEERLGYAAQNLETFEYAYPVKKGAMTIDPSFEDRQNFIFIGSGRHAPNVDAIHVLKREVWPKLREKLPHAQLHIYGENLPKSVTEMDSPRDGFSVRGWAEDQYETLRKYRVLLAPLRFGAGLKGKIADSWSVGLPVVTTEIGMEGYQWKTSAGLAQNPDQFVEEAVRIYSDASAWTGAAEQGYSVLCNQCSETVLFPKMDAWLDALIKNKEVNRRDNWAGQILWREQHRSTEFFSRWIQLKNRIEGGPGGAL